MGMEKSFIFTETPGWLREGMLSPGAWHSDALAAPCQPDGAQLLPRRLPWLPTSVLR